MIRPLRATWVLAFLAAVVSGFAPTASAQFKMLAPVDGAVVHAAEVLLVYTVAPETAVVYRLDGKPATFPGVSVPGNDWDLHHVRIPLTEGRHLVRVLTASDESELGRISLTHVPPYSLRTAASPEDKPYAFHTREREATCVGCHNLPEVFETMEDRPLAPAGKVCRACHPDVEAGPELHGPVAVYACFMCHAPEYSPSRFSQKGSQPASCGTCHEGFLARVLGGKKFVHGPVAAGGCMVCHDPHGGKTTSLVRETPPDLCLLCHSDTLPLPVERNLHAKVPCVRCHDPHGGQAPALTAAEGNAFCGTCHPKVAQMTSGHPVADHPVKADVDPTRPGRAMGCSSCHEAHSPSDVSKQNIAKNKAARIKFCRRCHY